MTDCSADTAGRPWRRHQIHGRCHSGWVCHSVTRCNYKRYKCWLNESKGKYFNASLASGTYLVSSISSNAHQVHGRWALVVLRSQMWTLRTRERSHFPKVACSDEQRAVTSEQGDGDSVWLKASAASTIPGRSWPRAAAEQEESALQPGGWTDALGNVLAPDRCYTQHVASSQLLTRAQKCVFIK